MTPNNNQVTNSNSAKDQKNINTTPGIEKDRQLILDAKKKGWISPGLTNSWRER